MADIVVDKGEWLTDEQLADLELRSGEWVVVLRIERGDGTYIGSPAGTDVIRPGDTLVVYGREDRLLELAARSAGDVSAHREARREHREIRTRERWMDLERPSRT